MPVVQSAELYPMSQGAKNSVHYPRLIELGHTYVYSLLNVQTQIVGIQIALGHVNQSFFTATADRTACSNDIRSSSDRVWNNT